jgi:hypothetical protein
MLRNDNVRTRAVEALRKIGPGAKATIPALIEMQHESIVGSYAKGALIEIREH